MHKVIIILATVMCLGQLKADTNMTYATTNYCGYITNSCASVYGYSRYIVGFELKQSRISLSISAHVKDAMNATKFELPVDKQFYDAVTIGQLIVNDFRAGSFIMSGTWGSWKLRCIGKREIVEVINPER